MKTYMAKSETVAPKWLLVDATDLTLGRLASNIAVRLRGKHKPEYTPHVDTGDHVVVVNIDKVRVSGTKETDKPYRRHTGYPGGLKEESFADLKARHPERILRIAVKGMLPKGPLGRQMLTKLKIYAGAEHPHEAQKPRKVEFDKEVK